MPRLSADPPRRVLIVRLSHLGDVACTLPVFHALRELWPAAEIAWACQPSFAGLLDGLPGLARVVPFDRAGGARAWLRLRAALAELAPDLAVDAQGNWKSAAVARLSGARRRVAWAPRDWREPLAARLATEHAPPVERAVPHLLDRIEALVRHLGHADPLRCDPGLRDGELEAAERALDARFGRAGVAPVVLQLAPPGDPRAWPEERAAELAEALQDAGRAHLVVSGPGEVESGQRLAARLGETPLRRHWVGQRGPRELAAAFAVIARRGGRFVGADSGPLHLAWTAGLPVVCLAGPQSHLRTGPWPPPGRAGSPHRAVLAASPPACAPCLRRRCDHPDGPVCTADIAVERVLAAL